MEYSSQSPDPGQVSCLGHDGTLDMLQRLERILEEREIIGDIPDEGITVNTGTGFEEVSLKNIHNFLGASSKEWAAIQQFYTVPNFTREDDLSEQRNRKKWESILATVRSSEPELTEEEAERRATREMMETEDKQFSNYLSVRAELRLQELVEEGMRGRAGLLIRNVKSEEHLYRELSQLLGIKIVPNCNEDHQHRKECYRMETDFLLLYPIKDKLAIRLIEVKRPNSVPWTRHVKKPLNSRLVSSAQEQLVRAAKFSLAFLPEVPTERLDLKAVLAFPESECGTVFCTDCSQHVVSLEDINSGPEQVLRKLSVQAQSEKDPADSDLFLRVCSRLLGKESLLHVGYRALGDKFSRSKEIQQGNINKVERELILLSPVQREVFRRLEMREHLQHFFFVGGSGTGKTHMSLLTIESLVKRYIRRNPAGEIVLYMAYRHQHPGENLALQKTFETFVKDKLKRGNLSVEISPLEKLGKGR